MKTLTLLLYASTTFLLAVLAISSLPVAFAAAHGNQAAQLIHALVVVLMVVGPLAFLMAIPFAGTRRDD